MGFINPRLTLDGSGRPTICIHLLDHCPGNHGFFDMSVFSLPEGTFFCLSQKKTEKSTPTETVVKYLSVFLGVPISHLLSPFVIVVDSTPSSDLICHRQHIHTDQL